MRKLLIAGLLSTIFIAANANVFADIKETEKNKKSAASVSVKTRESSVTSRVELAPAFDPYSAANMKAEYNQSQKSGKKFSTTTKVLIGVGIAAAVLAVVFVVAREDLKDDILR